MIRGEHFFNFVMSSEGGKYFRKELPSVGLSRSLDPTEGSDGLAFGAFDSSSHRLRKRRKPNRFLADSRQMERAVLWAYVTSGYGVHSLPSA